MNRYAFGTFKQRTGYLAWFRRVHDGQNKVLRHKGDDIIFATELEALKAAGEAFLEYVNLPISGANLTHISCSSSAKARAEQIFKKEEAA